MSDNDKIEPQILSKYQIIKKLGSGAYGHVWKVKQKSSQKIYALKKIFEAFQHSTDAQRTFRQISILKKVQHKNVIKLYQIFAGKNKRDVYLVFQFMQTDLYHALYQDILEPIHKKYVVYQMLLAIYYIHSTGIIHRDLKPSNVLLNTTCEAKICDFGLARSLNYKKQQNQVLTQGVATRWYRAPQVLLGSNEYDVKADIWSIGCIIAQILLKNPIFPGSSTINQLQRIIQFTGRPDKEDSQAIKCEFAQNFISQCQQIKSKSRKQYFGSQSQGTCVDLIYKILRFNPNKRLTIKQILKHEYFEQFYSQKDLIDSKRIVELQVCDNQKLSTQQYQKLIQNFQTIKRQKPFSCRPSSMHSYMNNDVATKSPLKSQNKSPLKANTSHKFGDIIKIRQPSFGKLLSQSKIKLRSESKDLKEENKNLHLFSEIIKNKDSGRKRIPSQQGKKQIYNKLTDCKNDKQNIHSNIGRQNKTNIDLKKFQSTTRSRVSFQGLKKTTIAKFGK